MSSGNRNLRGLLVPVLGILTIIAMIIILGNSFLASHMPGDKDRFDRPELWVGVGLLAGIMTFMYMLSRMPDGSGFLGQEAPFALGADTDADGRELPPIDIAARQGAVGTTADIAEGFTVYAQSGKLGTVQGLLPAGVDYGRKFSGMMYTQGALSASREMWIPYEAVIAVYPEAKSAFLAVGGDAAESLGWTNPPEGMTRGPKKNVPAADKIK